MRPKRRAKEQRIDIETLPLDQRVRVLLEKGHDLFSDFTDDDRRALWELHRDQVLAEWTAEHPGTRPAAWWMHDAPERRRRVDGKEHPFDQRRRWPAERQAMYGGNIFELSHGTPRILIDKDDFTAEYESESAYLRRLKLLTRAEAVALADD